MFVCFFFTWNNQIFNQDFLHISVIFYMKNTVEYLINREKTSKSKGRHATFSSINLCIDVSRCLQVELNWYGFTHYIFHTSAALWWLSTLLHPCYIAYNDGAFYLSKSLKSRWEVLTGGAMICSAASFPYDFCRIFKSRSKIRTVHVHDLAHAIYSNFMYKLELSYKKAL